MFCGSLSAAPESVTAPNASAVAANQLVVSGNACGPTALLNAFRMGNDSWQRPIAHLSEESDKACIVSLIREFGMRPSAHIKDRSRWSKKGINIADLCDMANDMSRGHYLPQLSQEVFFRSARETPNELLNRIHHKCITSLRKGFPPLLSLRRYAYRKQKGNSSAWVALDAHFVTLTEISAKLENGSRSFAVSYIDPWGGKRASGSIVLPAQPVLANDTLASPCAVAVFPSLTVGKKLIQGEEPHALVVAAALGRW